MTAPSPDPDSSWLIAGRAAPALRALAAAGFAGSIDCAYIDPPFNTGARIQAHGPDVGYDDDRSHSAWMAMMRPTLEGLRALLAPHGSLFIHLDDNELDYLKVEADRIFGRANFINRITVKARSPSSFSTVNRGVFKSSEYLLWYARDRARSRIFPQRVPRAPDRAYNMYLQNPDAPHGEWRFTTVTKACPAGRSRDAFQVARADRVCRLASISARKAGRATLEVKARSADDPGRVYRVDRPGLEPQYVLRGQQLIFYGKQVSEIDGARCASRPLTDIWTDIRWEGLAREGGVTFRQGKKPERLLRRCLSLCTRPGDRVLDCFLGSGTTAAVAQKMGRRWIGIEAGPHLELARGRLTRVIAGDDDAGVSRLEGWRGGGAFWSTSVTDEGVWLGAAHRTE